MLYTLIRQIFIGYIVIIIIIIIIIILLFI